MLKAFPAIVAAAVVAGGITILSAPVGDVVASPLPLPAAEAITTCSVLGPISIASAPNLAIHAFG